MTPPDTFSNIAAADGMSAFTLGVAASTYTAINVPYGGYSCLAVAAYNIAGASTYSPWVCGQVVPLTPFNPHMTSATTNSVGFAWNNYDAMSYIAATNGPMGFALGQNAMTYMATGISPGFYSCISVAAYNATYASPFSSWTCGFAMPAAPSGVHKLSSTMTSVTYVWNNQDPYSGIAATIGGPLFAVGFNATTYTQTGMTPGSWSCINLAAYNSSGASGYTGWACGQAV